MKQLRAWGPWAVLLALALAAGLAAGPSQADSDVPTVENRGARGVAVLATWLAESGVDVRVHREPLTALPRDVASVVLVAPRARRVQDDEIAALERFVQAGGTLVYLWPRRGQPGLARWLKLEAGVPLLWTTEPAFTDVGGATVEVRLPAGLLAGAARLRVSADRMLWVADRPTVPVATHGAVWLERLGAGEIWLAAGPDLAENARLELLDNATFWANLGARGPVVFDEFHHVAAAAPPVSLNLWAAALQFAFGALVFLAARGARLGPARPTAQTRHRSALEYVRAMAALTENARVEDELVERLRGDARLFLQERLGVPAQLPLHEAAREVERQTGVTAADVLRLGTERDFLALSRLVARLEAAAEGRG